MLIDPRDDDSHDHELDRSGDHPFDREGMGTRYVSYSESEYGMTVKNDVRIPYKIPCAIHDLVAKPRV